MKHFLLAALTVLTFHIASTPRAHALFGRINAEKQRRIEVEQMLTEQRQSTSHWQTTAFISGIGCVVMLVAGAAIGSKGRRDAK